MLIRGTPSFSFPTGSSEMNVFGTNIDELRSGVVGSIVLGAAWAGVVVLVVVGVGGCRISGVDMMIGGVATVLLWFVLTPLLPL